MSIDFAQEKNALGATNTQGKKENISFSRITENERLVKLKDVLDAIDKVSASLTDGAPSIDYKRGYDVAVRRIAADVRKLEPAAMQAPDPTQPKPAPKASSKSEPDDVWSLMRMICDREDCLPTAQEYVYETDRGRTYNVRVSIA